MSKKNEQLLGEGEQDVLPVQFVSKNSDLVEAGVEQVLFPQA